MKVGVPKLFRAVHLSQLATEISFSYTHLKVAPLNMNANPSGDHVSGVGANQHSDAIAVATISLV
jgi:hypothetical protein